MNYFEPISLIVILIFIILIIILQTFLFNYVMSDFIDIFLKNKTHSINNYLNRHTMISNFIDLFKYSESVIDIKNIALEQKKERQKINNQLMVPWIGIPLLITIVILFVFIYTENLNKKNWKEIGLLVVVMIIVTVISQLFLYHTIIKKYDYYGEKKLFNKVYQNIKKNIVIEPLPEGKKYKQTIYQIPNITKTFFQNFLENKTNNLSTYLNNKENNFSEYLNDKVNNLSEYGLTKNK